MVIFSTLLHRIFVELLFSKPSKNSVSLTNLLSCKFRGLFFDFYLNRKRNNCWLAAYSCDLFTYQHIRSFFLNDWSHTFAGYEKYCRIGRWRLSVVFLQITGWLSAESFENSVWKSAEQIPLRVLQWYSQRSFACSIGSTKSTIVYVFIVPLTDHRH